MEETLKGSRLDVEAYNAAKAERWEKLYPLHALTHHCLVHNTDFNPEVEPCWKCYHEFDKEL